MARTSDPLYSIWQRMRTLCKNPNVAQYDFYGGKGIGISQEWEDFDRFRSDVGNKPSTDHSLIRKDKSKDFGPGNWEWSTKQQRDPNPNCIEYCSKRRTERGIAQIKSSRFEKYHERKKSGLCVTCGRVPVCGLVRCQPCLDAINANRKKTGYAQRITQMHRELVFDHYGWECACCGESHWEFLQIDHIDGGGCKHRREVGSSLYRWLITNGFPEGFQTLCGNCNWSKGKRGYCPHQLERDAKFKTA